MILLVDTETTGMKNPRAVEVAIGVIKSLDKINEIELTTARFDPGVPIDTSASAVHDIVRKDIDGLSPFGNEPLGEMYKQANVEENYVIAHNAPYDLEVIKNEGIENKMKVIDTLRCAKRLLMDTPCEEYKLQYLKYYLKLNEEVIPEQIEKYSGKAHGAAADVVTLYLLFRRLASKYSLDELADMTKADIIYKVMPFGKHKGVPIPDILAKNRGYSSWVFREMEDRDVVASFKYYSKAASNKAKESHD
jgi:DNA polymerase III epsilon subunit-like protein